ncbi:MAG: inositol monophosphatase family protein [Thermoleophilaceae bacterium]
MSSLAADLELAERAARIAGEELMARYREPARGVERKSSDTDMVSEADHAAEAAIVELLTRERPEDGLLGEEGSEREGSSGRRWVVDPLDGTTNYLYRFPAWCVSVALEDAEGALVGAVHEPYTGHVWRASRAGGCELDGSGVRVRETASLDRALVATGFGYSPDRRTMQAEALLKIIPRVRDIRRPGAAALDLASVSCGRLDGYYERGLKPWDWAAGRLLVTEAGGVVRDLPGEPHGLVAAGPSVVDELFELVSGA